MSVSGTVKFFNDDKGFGFIKPDDGSRDVFVHKADLSKSRIQTLRENQRVSFEPEIHDKGPRATSVTLI